MTSVHCLEHVDALAPADLAHHDTVWSLAQGVFHQVANGHSALALYGRLARLHAHHMGMSGELELR